MTKKGRAAPDQGAIQQQTVAAAPEKKPPSGMLYIPKGSKSGVYACKFYDAVGRQRNRSAKTTDRDEALAFLAARVSEVKGGNFDEINVEKVTCSELFDDVVAEYKREEQRSIPDITIRWKKHLAEHFGGSFKAMNVTTDRLVAYIEWRQGQKASASTINRELALLRRCLRIGTECKPRKVRLEHIPKFPMLAENNVRKGFLSSADFDRLAAECSKIGLWLRAMLEVGYTLGWRREEVRTLKVSNFDQVEGTLSLDTSKNGEGRLVGLTQSLRALLGQLCIGKKSDDPIFTRDDGSEVKSFREIWHSVCIRAGITVNGLRSAMIHSCGSEVTSRGEGKRTRYHCEKCECDVHADDLRYRGLLFHDLRRSAAKNFARARVPQYTIQDIAGWKGASMFKRYRGILDVDRSHDAMRQLEQHREQLAAIAAGKKAAK